MKITIIGATGNIGSCMAFSLTEQRLADELVLIDDPRPDMLALHALDLNTSATGHDMLVRSGSTGDMRDSDIVIVAAGSAQVVASRMEVLPQNLPIIQDVSKNIKQFCPGAIVITATNPVCPLNYAMYHCSNLSRMKVIGYSYNDTIRFRMRLAQELKAASSEVEGTVIGEHGNSQVPLFSSVKVKGRKVSFSEAAKTKMRQQIPDGQKLLEDLRAKTGRTAAWTTAAGMAAVCRSIVKNTGEMIPCSTVLEGEYGYRGLSMSVPVVLGKGGIQKILEIDIAPDERQYLQSSVEVLEPAMRYVDKYLHLC
jgi:malate dehydrogenase